MWKLAEKEEGESPFLETCSMCTLKMVKKGVWVQWEFMETKTKQLIIFYYY